MSRFSHRALMLVTAAQKNAANQAALQWDPVGGAQTFTVSLNATGLLADPATHYWSSAVVTDDVWQGIEAMLPSFPGSHVEDWDIDDDPGRPKELLNQLGLKVRSAPRGG